MKEWTGIVLFVVAFLLVHLAKMIRLYLVLLEQKISFPRFVLIYLQTTFVNLLIPFKLGELFRIYCLSRETKKVPVGVLSVVVDRFFDTAALLTILLTLQLFVDEHVTGVTLLLLAAILLLAFAYWMFGPTYTYLNRYLIKNKNSARSMMALRLMDYAKDWFVFVKELVVGRSALIFLFSFLGWGFEVVALLLLSGVLHINFGIAEVSTYIGAIFLSGESRLLTIYSAIGAAGIGMATVIVYIFFKGSRRSA